METTAAEIRESLQRQFPFGDSLFIPLALSEIELHSDKNHDYAKGGSPLGNFERSAAILKLYPGFPYDTPEGWALLNLLKQLDAVLWGLTQRIEHKVEGLESRLGDVSVYAKIVRCMIQRKRESIQTWSCHNAKVGDDPHEQHKQAARRWFRTSK